MSRSNTGLARALASAHRQRMTATVLLRVGVVAALAVCGGAAPASDVPADQREPGAAAAPPERVAPMRVMAGTGCGDPTAGDCCIANGTPYCDNEECCEFICDQDPFCCDVDWDTICADAACQKCDTCFCPFLGCGDSAFGDCCEANNSPYCEHPACCECICVCDPFCCGAQWDSLCAGEGVDGFCGASNPDGPCADECAHCLGGPPPPGDCEGDVTGDGTVGPADLIALVDAWGPCADPENCPADLNGDGVVDLQDLFILLGDWGCEEDDKKLSCGNLEAGSCCTSNPTPYCDDEACCKLICAQDPFCCDVQWDQLCASAAGRFCMVCLKP